MDEALAQEVDVAIRVLDVSTVDFVRSALTAYLDELRGDPAFQQDVAAMIEANARALARARGAVGEQRGSGAGGA